MTHFYKFDGSDEILVIEAPDDLADAIAAVVSEKPKAVRMAADAFLESGLADTATISKYVMVEDACPECQMPVSMCTCDLPDVDLSGFEGSPW